METRNAPGEVHNLPLEYLLCDDQRSRALRLPHRYRPVIRTEGDNGADIGGVYRLGRIAEEDVWVVGL